MLVYSQLHGVLSLKININAAHSFVPTVLLSSFALCRPTCTCSFCQFTFILQWKLKAWIRPHYYHACTGYMPHGSQ